MSSSHRALRNHLFRLRQSELDELFTSLPATSGNSEPLQGVYRGALMAIAGVQHLPRALSVLIYRLFSTPVNPWRGKAFAASGGANVWFSVSRDLRFGRYHSQWTEQGLELDYSATENGRPVNPTPLRPIRGEARPMQDGVWLARMRWQGKKQRNTLLYFVLWQE